MSTLSLRRYGASHGSHSHGHFQVLVGLEGVLELEVAGRGRRIGAGDAWLVAPGERHDFESARGSACLVLDSAHEGWARCAATPARAPQTLALASYLAQALALDLPLAQQLGPALLLESWAPGKPLASFSASWRPAPPGAWPPASAGQPARPRRPIDWPALAAWAQARMDQPLTVAQLAARCLLSTSQFTQRCHEANGQGPMQWLRSLRLAQARQLRGSGLAVAEVARRTGYRSPSALTAALRRCTG